MLNSIRRHVPSEKIEPLGSTAVQDQTTGGESGNAWVWPIVPLRMRSEQVLAVGMMISSQLLAMSVMRKRRKRSVQAHLSEVRSALRHVRLGFTLRVYWKNGREVHLFGKTARN